MKKLLFSVVAILAISLPNLTSAQNTDYQIFQAEVIQVNEETVLVNPDTDLTVEPQLELPTVNLKEEIRKDLEPGDRIIIENYKTDENNNYNPIDYARNTQIYVLFGIFIALSILIGRKKGFFSILTLIGSFYILFNFTIAQIAAGNDPIIISIITAIIIIPFGFYLTHGFKKQTTAAVFGTLISLTLTILLASFFVEWTRLTGNSSDEVFWLTQNFADINNLKGLLIGAILLGMIGVLDDISITQASIVQELYNSGKPHHEIYKSAMRIGRDHISSMINTLILVYASAALPLFILLSQDLSQLNNLINIEVITEELVRMLVASIGLIISVPISTWIASKMLKNSSS
ncbi:hypothetical protein GF376_01150 [Candidatus Peregrinibacteria bacterium]|nr:hypothetical protein [Candidatus Peregrinibacteria bacterium]